MGIPLHLVQYKYTTTVHHSLFGSYVILEHMYL